MTTSSSDFRRTRIHLDPMSFAGSANLHRTSGLHLTDIINDIMVSVLGVDRRNNAFTESDLASFQLQGYLWELLATEGLSKHAKRTEGQAFDFADYSVLPELAVSLNGQSAFPIDPDYPPAPEELINWIIMSPDGMRVNPLRLLEFKWTTTSVNKEPKREWFYQAPGYLKGLQLYVGPTNDVEWLVQFPCGDYRGSGVITERWERTFSDQQIEDNWSMLAGHAVDRASADPAHPWNKWIVAA